MASVSSGVVDVSNLGIRSLLNSELKWPLGNKSFIKLGIVKTAFLFVFIFQSLSIHAQTNDILSENLLTNPVLSYQSLSRYSGDDQSLGTLLQKAFLQHLLGLSEELNHSLQVMPMITPNDSVELQSFYYFLQGAHSGKEGRYKEAESYLEQAQSISDSLPSSRLWVLASQELAYTYGLQENFEIAFNTLQQAFHRAQDDKDQFALAISEQSLAAIYSYADNYDLAIFNYQRALSRYKQLSYPAYISETLLGIATTFRHSEQWDKALVAYENYAQALDFQDKVGSTFYYHYGKSMTLALSGRCDAALAEIRAAIKVGGPRDYLGELHKKSALCYTKNLDVKQAELALGKAKFIIDNSPEMQNTLWHAELVLIESDIAKVKGDLVLALDLFREYHDKFTHLQSKKTSDNLIRLKSKLESERKDIEIELLSQRTQLQELELVAFEAKQQNRLIITVCVAVLLLAFALFQHRKSKQLYQLSVKDTLTGLFNRRYAIEMMNQWLGPQRNSMRNWTVIMIDIDHFKQVNDTYGHGIGDKLLKAMADEASKVVRPSDLLARFGGEEFVCALTRIDPSEAEKIAERLRAQLANVTIQISDGADSNNVDAEKISRTASIGVAHIKQHDTQLKILLDRADKALYQAKHNGRNCVVVAE